jgi:putative peptidoglycan lipid II flippase
MMPHLGIAIATTIGGWLQAILLWATLRRRGHYVADGRLKRALPMIVACSLVMGAALWLAAGQMSPWLDRAAGLMPRVLALSALVAGGSLLYLSLAWATGALRLASVKAALRRSG